MAPIGLPTTYRRVIIIPQSLFIATHNIRPSTTTNKSIMTSSHLAVIAATLLSSTSGGRASAKLQGGPTDVHSTGSARGDHEVDRFMLVSISLLPPL